jgi:predicted AAA+ superfamily ATPase
MKKRLFDLFHLSNPWLKNPMIPIISRENLIPRLQLSKMLNPAWDEKCTILIGPRQAGKTMLQIYSSNSQTQSYSCLIQAIIGYYRT